MCVFNFFFSALALKCNRCVPRAGGSCHTTVETCQRNNDVCASVVITKPRYSYFKRCMKESDALILSSVPNTNVYTCTTDLCN
uniref:UPAR/Ly6 domain-containing protein n=1 Tax=Monopterus albus TaxID=43700 RepID=A0A3Q3KRW6_MONAL